MAIVSDLRYAVRSLLHRPIFTSTAVLSLAFGIAATTSIFALADALLWQPRIGVQHPETLVDVGRSTGGSGLDNFGYPLFERYRDNSHMLEAIAATQFAPNVVALGNASSSERVYATLVSYNYFDLIGVRAAAGRFFLADEDRTPGTHPVVVLSHDFWARRFGADAALIGQTIRLNTLPYTVVGVAEPGFTGTTFIGSDMWIPMAMDAHVRAADASLLDQDGAVWMTAIGRLKAGVTPEQARAELDGLMRAYLRERNDARIDTWAASVARSSRVPEGIRLPVVAFIAVLGTLTGVVLLIACTNVAGLLLARAIERRREVATRLAIGASRIRILRQLLTECVGVALLAGAASVPLTSALITLLASVRPSLPIPLAVEPGGDPRVMLFGFAVALLTVVVFGLLPALHATRFDLAAALHGHSMTADRRRAWLRQALVAAQVAMTLLLLVASGLLLRSLQRAAAIDLGFEVENVDTMEINTRIGGYRTDADGIRVVQEIENRVGSLRGVVATGASRMVPLFSGRLGLGGLRAPGYIGPDGTDRVSADWDTVTPGYFGALRIQLVEGRAFDERDREGATPVAIVNDTMARRLWPDRDPIGRQLIQQVSSSEERMLQIVGVTRTAKSSSVSEPPTNFIYVPLAQQYLADVTLFVRHAPGPSMLSELRRIIATVDPNLPVIYTQTLEQATGLALLPQRLAAWTAASVGTIGLLLAALGLYGLTAFTVAQRSREIALRIALGATRESVLSLVLGQAGRLAAAGGVIGLALSFGVAQVLGGQLVGIGPVDPVAFGIATLVLTAALLAATWTPARRAARMDPMRVLRSE